MHISDIFKGSPTPAKWAALGEYLMNCGTIGGPGLRVRRMGNKILITTRRKRIAKPGGGGPEGAFYTIYTVDAEDATNGDIMLAGGQVTGGTGNAVIAPILLFDKSASGGAGAWTGTAGQVLQLEITGTGSEVDDVLMPTFDVDDPLSAPAASASLSTNVLPTVSALSGTCFVSLGVFTDEGFTPSNIGNINVSFCYGGFTVSRF